MTVLAQLLELARNPSRRRLLLGLVCDVAAKVPATRRQPGKRAPYNRASSCRAAPRRSARRAARQPASGAAANSPRLRAPEKGRGSAGSLRLVALSAALRTDPARDGRAATSAAEVASSSAAAQRESGSRSHTIASRWIERRAPVHALARLRQTAQLLLRTQTGSRTGVGEGVVPASASITGHGATRVHSRSQSRAGRVCLLRYAAFVTRRRAADDGSACLGARDPQPKLSTTATRARFP